MVEEARRMGIDVTILPMCHWLYFKKNAWYWRNLVGRSWSNVQRIKRLIREQCIELVYTNTSAIFESAVAARHAGVPHLWHVHEVLTPGSAMSQLLPIRWMQRFIKRYSDQVVFESHSAKSAFEQTTKLTNADVVFNSVRIDVEELSITELESVRTRFEISDTFFRVVCIGQFIARKNPLLLIDAIAKLNAYRTIQCLFIGAGPLEKAMRESIATHGLEQQCLLIPFQQDIRPFIQLADVLVLPSRQESFGLVLIEAGALGKPVIACRSQGPNEIVANGQTGILVGQDDVDALAAAVQYLAASPTIAVQMGKKARARVAEHFSPVENTRRLEELLDRLLEDTKPTTAGAALTSG